MLSSATIQDRAVRFFEYHTRQGLDMSNWTVLRSHPATVPPADLVLLAEHTGEEIGTLLGHGIGVDNKIKDLQEVIVFDAKVLTRTCGRCELAA